MYKRYIKRWIDILASLTMLTVLLPIIAIISTSLFIDLKGNPFFLQKRAGLKGNPFKVIKFRTMSNEKDGDGVLLPDHLRLSKFGRFIRRLSLDEIPQLFNVFLGQMSFIGPRPFLYEYMGVYTKEEKTRHNVRPGITGWAQINGRNSLSWKEKFKLDLFYVDNLSLWLDIKIAILTILKVVRKEGVDQGEEVTMEKYNGRN